MDLDTIRRARVVLAKAAEPPAPALERFIADIGPVQAADRVLDGEVPTEVANEIRPQSEGIRVDDRDLGDSRRGIHLLIPEDENWPTPLWDLTANRHTNTGVRLAAPVALWVRAADPALSGLLERSVSVVGSRAASAYGELIASDLGDALAGDNITTTSGAAYGVDSAAHRGALTGSGATVAFAPCGVDHDYPTGNASLLASIARHGAVVSEYPPGTVPARHRFVARNRLIACASPILVVVEAGLRSGSLSTARAAGDLNRTVMAVPGPITSAQSLGTNQLLRDRAAVAVTSLRDVLDAFHEASVAGTDATPN